MIVVDTTVLVYAMGTEHLYRDPCRRLVSAVEGGQVAATTTVEAIQEFAHVRARRRGREDAADLARAYADLFAPLLVVEESDLREGLRLYERHELGSFDAVLAAATWSAGAASLVSADGAFGSVPGLDHVVPDESGIAGLLASAAEESRY